MLFDGAIQTLTAVSVFPFFYVFASDQKTQICCMPKGKQSEKRTRNLGRNTHRYLKIAMTTLAALKMPAVRSAWFLGCFQVMRPDR